MVSIKFLLVLVLLFWSIWSFNIQHPLPSSPTGICIYSLFKLFPTTRTKTVFKCPTWVPNLIFNWSVKDKISNCDFFVDHLQKGNFLPLTMHLQFKRQNSSIPQERLDSSGSNSLPYPLELLWGSSLQNTISFPLSFLRFYPKNYKLFTIIFNLLPSPPIPGCWWVRKIIKKENEHSMRKTPMEC